MNRRLLSIFAGLLLLSISLGLGSGAHPGLANVDRYEKIDADSADPRIFLPLITGDYLSPSYRLCRFGVGGGGVNNYQINDLRIGWYVDWTVRSNPARPGGMDYMPMVRLTQSGPTSYRYHPTAAVIQAEAAKRPGAVWIIGNEPDSIWQDDLVPSVYARAYHEMYHLIKDADPTARVAAGSIVQPTPLRLQYLDMVLDSYLTLYGTAMPVDVWNTHAFILREEAGSWGADIPPGIDATEGMLYDIDDNDNITIFKQSIRTFRQWMADNGYRESPLIITEFGVQMWPDLGFPPDRVQAFMEATFDYLLTARDPDIGYPDDENRLVQQWAWYSVSDDGFNGWLFDPVTRQRTVHGDNFTAYTAALTPGANLRPVEITAAPLLAASEEGTGAMLQVKVVNSGDIPIEEVWTTRVYLGDPENGGELLGTLTAFTLDGCGAAILLDFEWVGAQPGSHTITVVVDPDNAIDEVDEQDNILVVVVDF